MGFSLKERRRAGLPAFLIGRFAWLMSLKISVHHMRDFDRGYGRASAFGGEAALSAKIHSILGLWAECFVGAFTGLAGSDGAPDFQKPKCIILG